MQKEGTKSNQINYKYTKKIKTTIRKMCQYPNYSVKFLKNFDSISKTLYYYC
jgi:hypothetical protein